MTEQAWLTAMLTRVKKAPALSGLLTPKKPKAKRMDWQDMYNAAAAWAGRSGATITEVAGE
ncbi:conserved hypothetical protein [Sphingomonas aurantiaca]|uniref:Uncharacterized protein n=1 Tax=Sphingomonas aurantiaca TaxID=185949 RepID=A0A5E7ZMQ2_9SPHN|nr:hypothetical protein [Sphingomonas aurantiaca]VVT20286.1 conserved hypothetical protein [Sphingomonas aurantiaca]